VTSLLSDARSIALETESVDCVYCISVLEHIPDFEAVISEIGRLLRPGGLLVLTFDVDLRGNWELGPDAYTRLMDALEGSFAPVYPETVIHPLRVLTTVNSIYPMYVHRSILDPLIAPLRHTLHSAYNRLRGRQLPSCRLLASTYGAYLRKHGSLKFDSEVEPAELSQAL
jgi:ubiquinone/menaquinone biosynthesis C-methylase UbiE